MTNSNMDNVTTTEATAGATERTGFRMPTELEIYAHNVLGYKFRKESRSFQNDMDDISQWAIDGFNMLASKTRSEDAKAVFNSLEKLADTIGQAQTLPVFDPKRNFSPEELIVCLMACVWGEYNGERC